jgi:uncharacterized protein YfaS (alpha-2-macroglobulin family)
MAVRGHGHWETTQETAWAVMALTDFAVSSGELNPSYGYTVSLNGRAIQHEAVSPSNVAESRRLVAAITELLVDEGNRVLISRAPVGVQGLDQGQLYYTMGLRYFVPTQSLEAVDRGLVVSRRYAVVDRPEEPVTKASAGDVIAVRLTIVNRNDAHYFVLEDPLPAGCEALDASLRTTSAAVTAPRLRVLGEQLSFWTHFSHSELRDDRVAVFAEYLPLGTYEYTYLMRATIPGAFHVLPTIAQEMYFPEVFGRSQGSLFTVAP